MTQGYVIQYCGAYYTDNPPVSPDYGWVLGIKYATKFDTKQKANEVANTLDESKEVTLINLKKFKTNKEVWQQYTRLIQRAFPKVRIKADSTWNWHDVYKTDPYTNATFVRIHNAYRNTCDHYKCIDMKRFIGWDYDC